LIHTVKLYSNLRTSRLEDVAEDASEASSLLEGTQLLLFLVGLTPPPLVWI